MAKPKKTRAGTGSHAQDEDEETPEMKLEDKPAEAPAAHPKQGTTFTVDGQEVTFEAERQLAASPNSGVAAGVYQIVSTLLKPGNRKVYRAVVGDTLYPIRGYDTANEVISKVRESSKEPRKSRKASAAKPVSHAPSEGFSLTDAADDILRDYLALKKEDDADAVLSHLVETHLGPEVAKLKAAQDAISKLPIDLLTALANASDEKRRKILEALT